MAGVQSKGDVVIYVTPGHEACLLKYDGYPGLAFQIFPCEIDGSCIRRQKAGADIKEGRFSAARGSYEGHEFFLVQGDIDILQYRQDLFAVPEGFADLIDNNFHR